MKTLVIFDIDGTLLQTADLHHRLITKILADDGLDVTFQPWPAYPHYTDIGVISELYRHFHQRDLTAEELARYDAAYEAALRDHLSHTEVPEVAGAAALIRDLSDMPDVAVAYATGSLRGMAKVKLGLLGVDADGAALATGGEYLTREEIVTRAAALACADEPLRAVILGDGIWDQRTAAALGLPFVALETGTHVFDDQPVLTVKDFSTLSAEALVALARPVTFSERV